MAEVNSNLPALAIGDKPHPIDSLRMPLKITARSDFSRPSFDNLRTNGKILVARNREVIGSHILSDIAKAQIANLQIADVEIPRLQQQLEIAQVARESFPATLQAEFAELG